MGGGGATRNSELGTRNPELVITLLYLALGLATFVLLIALTHAVDRWDQD